MTSPDLATLTRRYRDATKALEKARDQLAEGIRAASAAGTRQADIVRAIDHEWTREYVAKILKSGRG